MRPATQSPALLRFTAVWLVLLSAAPLFILRIVYLVIQGVQQEVTAGKPGQPLGIAYFAALLCVAAVAGCLYGAYGQWRKAGELSRRGR